MDKIEEGASHLMGCQLMSCAQKCIPRARKILDMWGPNNMVPNLWYMYPRVDPTQTQNWFELI